MKETDECEKLKTAKEALRKTKSPYLRRDLTKYIRKAERQLKRCNFVQTKT